MTNIEVGSQRIRRLPDKPIVGETYPQRRRALQG